MRSLDINRVQHYQPQYSPQRPKKPRRKLKWFLILLVLLASLGWAGTRLLSKTNQIFTNQGNIFTRVGKLIVSSDKELRGEENGYVNVLLLGMGGPGHDGPLLTDTILVANINVETKDVVLMSIPRDFIVQIPSRGFGKVNAVYAYAEQDKRNSGGQAAIDAVEKITGMEIPYYAAIDFKGFEKAIDHVGGIDVVIDRTFTDSSYPDNKNWYLDPVTFKAGPEHMNGERALIFARSRKGNNGEGSDFARSERQKKVLLALKDRVVKLNLTDLKTLNNLLGDFTENFRTNMEPHELKRLGEIGKTINAEAVYSLSLAPQGNLICDGVIGEYENRAYVVQPCEGKTLSDIHAFLANAPLIAKLNKENAIIEIINSTGKSYATENWRAVADSGLNIRFTTFKGRSPYDRTIFYDNSLGKKPRTLEYLTTNFNFSKSDVPYSASNADFVIILGNDAL